ncbi:MAG: BNR-4 repeat-containing protein [Candidatus Hydrogenedentota bacterium]
MIFDRIRLSRFVQLNVLLCVLLLAGSVSADDTAWSADFRIGGCGGVYFLAEPGEFWVEVEKQDRNFLSRKTHVRAILFGPDRSVLAEEILPHMGMKKGDGAGPVQRLRFSVTVPRTGVYGLSITASEDRLGEDMSWGIKTNCSRYLVETSRGHKDGRHQEPLSLRNGKPGDVYFLPRTGEFTIDGAGCAPGTLRLVDGAGTERGFITVGKDGKFLHTIPAEIGRENVPWKLELSNAQCSKLNIDGVTRWDKSDGNYNDLSLWTPKAASWFPFHQNRWLITPYKQRIDVAPGSSGEATVEIHNNAPLARTIDLAIEFPGSKTGSATLSTDTVQLEANQTATVVLRYDVPYSGDLWPFHVRATPRDKSGFSTYVTIDLRRDSGQSAEARAMPIVLRPYAHENAQFGYRADYPLSGEVYFDTENTPVVSAKNELNVLQNGQWKPVTSAQQNKNAPTPFTLATSKVAFDSDNDRYAMATQNGRPVLVHGTADGEWKFYPIPGKGTFDIEQFSGHNTPQGPPPFVRFTRTASDPKLLWRRIHDLALFLPEKNPDGSISIGEPIMLSRMCIGLSSHSGIPSTIVSRGSKVHVAWGEATDPKEKIPGVPTYVATIDRETRVMSTPTLVGYGPPANDIHNTPCITMDSQGVLHVLIGTHARTFKYAHSLKSNDSSGGWTAAEDISPGIRQTYVGLVCDPNDTLHLVFRHRRSDTDYFPASWYMTLAYMQKPADGDWSEPQPLVIAPFSEYSIFYHRLTIDRKGALFLSYDHWSTYWFYRSDRRETRRALITRPTDGDTWKFVTDKW